MYFELRCSLWVIESSPKPSGAGGFGYDPLFAPEGHDGSFAELGSAVKNAMSHRGRALKQVMEWLESQAGEGSGIG